MTFVDKVLDAPHHPGRWVAMYQQNCDRILTERAARKPVQINHPDWDRLMARFADVEDLLEVRAIALTVSNQVLKGEYFAEWSQPKRESFADWFLTRALGWLDDASEGLPEPLSEVRNGRPGRDW